MISSSSPIGFFDSGIGGTSIWKEVTLLLPNENTVFLADSKNAPYGLKSKEAIIALSKKNTDYLLSKNCKLIVVACNTATTNAITYLRTHYTVPFIGIEPAIKPAAIKTKTNVVGVLATKGTLSSELFSKTSSIHASKIKVIEQDGDGIVELIENGMLHSEKMYSLLKRYLQPMVEKNIDYLVLGCTHYPYLNPILKELLPAHIRVIDSGYAVAKQVKRVLSFDKLLNTENQGIHNIISNSHSKAIEQFIETSTKTSINYADF